VLERTWTSRRLNREETLDPALAHLRIVANGSDLQVSPPTVGVRKVYARRQRHVGSTLREGAVVAQRRERREPKAAGCASSNSATTAAPCAQRGIATAPPSRPTRWRRVGATIPARAAFNVHTTRPTVRAGRSAKRSNRLAPGAETSVCPKHLQKGIAAYWKQPVPPLRRTRH
jgi:hypothetical protein